MNKHPRKKRTLALALSAALLCTYMVPQFSVSAAVQSTEISAVPNREAESLIRNALASFRDSSAETGTATVAETAVSTETTTAPEEVVTTGTTDDGYTYSITNGSIAAITGYTGTDTELVIPSSVEGVPVTQIGKEAFPNAKITSVIFPDTLELIGEGAFGDCDYLTTMDIPPSVTTIGKQAFYSCGGLKEVSFPEGLLEIGESAFVFSTISEVHFPNSLTTIGNSAFQYTQLTAADIPDTVTSLGNSAFEDCDSLTKATIGSGVTVMSEYAFFGCEKLTEVSLPAGLTEIQKGAFKGTALTQIDFPDTLTTIGYQAFCGVPLTELHLSDSITTLDHSFSDIEELKSVTLPSSIDVTTSSNAFSDCGLESVTFAPGTVSSMPYCFSNCDALTEINFPASMTEIGDFTFGYCDGLTTVALPNGITVIGSSAFYNCKALTAASLPDSVNTIGSSAFYQTALTEIDWPASIETVDDYAFGSIETLKSVTVPSTINPETSSRCFAFSGLESIVFADGTTTIIPGICDGCKNLVSVSIPEGVTKIGSTAFYECGFETITLPSTLTYIDPYAFQYCQALRSVTLPDALTTVGGYSFGWCSSLKELTIPAGLQTCVRSDIYYRPAFESCGIEKLVFAEGTTKIAGLYGNMYNLKEIVIPESVTEIEHAFSADTALEKVYIPASVTEMDSPFNASGLQYVEFGDGMTSIPASAMQGAEMLVTAVIPESVTEFQAYAFYNCSSLKNLSMPQDSVTFTHNTFTYCDSLKDERVSLYDLDKTCVISNTQSEIVGGITNYFVRYRISDRFFEHASDSRIYISLDGCEVVESSLTVEGSDFASYYCTIPTYSQEGTLTFSLKKISNDMKVGIRFETKLLHFGDEYYFYEQNIDSSTTETASITLGGPLKTATHTVMVHGITALDTDVTLFVDGVEQATCHSDLYLGRYFCTLTLPEKETSSYTIQAKTASDSSAPMTVTISAESPFVSKVVLEHNSHGNNNRVIDATPIFEKGISPVLAYNPARPLTFQLSIENPELVEHVFVTSDKGEEMSCLEAFYDAKNDVWVASGFFETSVPGNLNVSIIEKAKTQTLTATTSEAGTITVDTEYEDAAVLDKVVEKMTGALDYADENTAISEYSYIDDRGTIDYGVFNGISDSVVMNGETVSAAAVAENPTDYGFQKTAVQLTDENGVQHAYYLKLVTQSEDAASILAAALSKADKTDLVKDFTASFGDVMSGVVIFDMIQNSTLGGSSKFVSTLFSVGAIELLHRNVELVSANGTVLAGGVNGFMGGLTAALSCVDFATDLIDIYDADPSNTVVNEHASALILCSTAVAVSRIGATFLAVSAVSAAVATTLAIGPVVATAAAIAVVALVNYGISAIHGYLRKLIKGNSEYSEDGKLRYLIDPSGIVYEWLPSNPVSGVKTTIYYKDAASGEAVLWDAAPYDQMNPLVTDAAGWYAWDVPEGLWQVCYEKDGYETAYSEWLPVCPVQTDVNVALVSKEAPEMTSVFAYEDEICVIFSKFMQDSSLTADTLFLTAGENGAVIPCSMRCQKAKDNQTDCSMQVVLTPKSGSFADYDAITVHVSADACSYSGVAAIAQTETVTLLQKLGDVTLDTATIHMNVGDTADIQLTAPNAPAGTVISVQSDGDAVRIPAELTLSADGTAVLSLEAVAVGTLTLTFSANKGAWTQTVFVAVGIHMETLQLAPVIEEEPTVALLGDPSGDSKITADDAILVLKEFAARMIGKSMLTETQLLAADMNEDNTVNADDAIQILKFYAASMLNTGAR